MKHFLRFCIEKALGHIKVNTVNRRPDLSEQPDAFAYVKGREREVRSSYRKSRGPSPGGAADRSGCGIVLFFPFTAPVKVFMADHRCGGKRGRVITALTTVTGLLRRKRVHSK